MDGVRSHTSYVSPITPTRVAQRYKLKEIISDGGRNSISSDCGHGEAILTSLITQELISDVVTEEQMLAPTTL